MAHYGSWPMVLKTKLGAGATRVAGLAWHAAGKAGHRWWIAKARVAAQLRPGKVYRPYIVEQKIFLQNKVRAAGPTTGLGDATKAGACKRRSYLPST